MRVAAILPNHAPHFGRYWADAAAVFAEVVTIEFVRDISLPARSPGVGSSGSSYQVERVDLRPSRMMQPISQRWLAKRVRVALELAERDHGEIDLLHTHYYHQTGIMPYLVRRWPYVHTEHSLAMLSGLLKHDAHYSLSKAGMQMARRGFEGASCVIAVSAFLAASMECLALPGAPFVVIPNPVDEKIFYESVRRDGNTIAWVGRLSEDKQPELALRGFALATRAPGGAELRLIVVGEGPLQRQLVRLASELGVHSRVDFAGKLERSAVGEVVRLASVVLNSSKVESFSVATAEALLSGTPIVGPRVAALPELVDAQNGILYDPGDAGAMSMAILSAFSHEWDHGGIASRARNRVGTIAVSGALQGVYEAAIR